MKFKKTVRSAFFKILAIFIVSNLNMARATLYIVNIQCFSVNSNGEGTLWFPQPTDLPSAPWSSGAKRDRVLDRSRTPNTNPVSAYKFIVPPEFMPPLDHSLGGFNIPVQDIVSVALLIACFGPDVDVRSFRSLFIEPFPDHVIEIDNGYREVEFFYNYIKTKVVFFTERIKEDQPGCPFRFRFDLKKRSFAVEIKESDYKLCGCPKIQMIFEFDTPPTYAPMPTDPRMPADYREPPLLLPFLNLWESTV
jgi:hypothetical protein